MSHGADSRRGFSVIEILIVIVIISLLMGLLIQALSLLQRERKRIQTSNLMKQLSIAVTDYLQTYPLLGLQTNSSDFVDSPWTFLGKNPLLAGNVPYTGDMPMRYLAQGTISGGGFTQGTQTTADQILDAFPSNFSNHFIWYIIDATNPNNGSTYTDKVYIRSQVGTPLNANDDLIMRLTTADGIWANITYQQSLADSPAPAW